MRNEYDENILLLVAGFTISNVANAQRPWPTPPPPPKTVVCEVFCGAEIPACGTNGKNEFEVYKTLRAMILKGTCTYQYGAKTQKFTCSDIPTVIKNGRSNCYNYATNKVTTMTTLESAFTADKSEGSKAKPPAAKN